MGGHGPGLSDVGWGEVAGSGKDLIELPVSIKCGNFLTI